MVTTYRFTTADLESLPDTLDDTRYEIIDGELYVSTQPSLEHQFTTTAIASELRTWSRRTRRGTVFTAPGVIFADDDNVAPDVVWVSRQRLRAIAGEDRKLHAAPDLVVEILSPGSTNERRDRDAKLKLYSLRGVIEYWIADPLAPRIDAFRRQAPDAPLLLARTYTAEDTLSSPLLPGFTCAAAELFFSEAELAD